MKNMSKKALIGHLAAATCVVFWGLNGVFNKTLVSRYGTSEVMLLRFLITYPALWIVDHSWLKVEWKSEKYFVLAGLFGNALYSFLTTLAYEYAPASIVGVLMNISPVFIAMISMFILKESRMTKFFVLGFFVTVTGMALVSLDGTTNLSVGVPGLVLPIIGAVCYATYTTFLGKLHQAGYAPTLITRRVFFYGIVFTVPMLFMRGMDFTLEGILEPKILFAVVFICLISSLVCSLFWNKAISCLGTLTTSLYIYLSPVSNVVCATLILHEGNTWMTYVGVVLIMIGVYFSGKKKKEIKNADN